MLIKDLMESSPLTVESQRCLREAIPLMSEHKSSCLLVVEKKRPVGIITERDVTRMFTQLIHDNKFASQPLAEVMTVDPVCVHEDTPLDEVLTLSRSRKLRHLPVINDDQHVVGVVNQTNLLNAYVKVIDHNTELEHAIEELKLLSLEDPLMGIGNRRAMEVELRHSDLTYRRNQSPYNIALLDIDFFKAYNDHYGHQAGDVVLKSVAQALKESLRSSDRIFRYGGEEILIILRDADQNQVQQSCERLRGVIESLNIEHCKSEFKVLTASIGVASATNAGWEVCSEQADKALYQAKRSGRNRVCAA